MYKTFNGYWLMTNRGLLTIVESHGKWILSIDGVDLRTFLNPAAAASAAHRTDVGDLTLNKLLFGMFANEDVNGWNRTQPPDGDSLQDRMRQALRRGNRPRRRPPQPSTDSLTYLRLFAHAKRKHMSR
jgi:hypothetical protein